MGLPYFGKYLEHLQDIVLATGGGCMGGTQLVSSHALVGIPILTMIIINLGASQ